MSRWRDLSWGREEEWLWVGQVEVQMNGSVLGVWSELNVACLKFEKGAMFGVFVPAKGWGYEVKHSVTELI